MEAITRTELVQLRIKFLKDMNQYIINMGDEDIWWDWIAIGVPDEASEEDYEYIAENDDEWESICTLFGNLTRKDWDK